jgi:CRISPR/Cas system-associated endoribonuclease Cas2
MNYFEELIERIKDNQKWPAFDRPDFLDELDTLADEAISKKTIEGYLAALLIYQQLAEETVKLLLKDHEFFIQLSVFPAEITFPSKSNAMFGRIIEDLKNTITLDKSKITIIELANKLNQIRIDIVHGLTKMPDLKQIESKVLEAKRLYDDLFEHFDEEHDKFRVIFKDFKKDRDWDEELQE